VTLFLSTALEYKLVPFGFTLVILHYMLFSSQNWSPGSFLSRLCYENNCLWK